MIWYRATGFLIFEKLNNIFTKKKRSGGKRIIHEPLHATLEVQNNLYYNFFVKVYTHDVIDDKCTGGVKGKSTKDNVMAHSFLAPKFISEVDIQDAFHCVTTESLKMALYDLFQIEVYYYRFAYYMFLKGKKHKNYKLENGQDEESINAHKSQLYEMYMNEGHRIWQSSDSGCGLEISDFFEREDPPWHKRDAPDLLNYMQDFIRFSKNRKPIFPHKRNRLFRESIRDPLAFDYVSELCKCMADIVSQLVTYNGKLIQGPPTSPFMMALMVTYTKLLSRFNFDPPRRIYRHTGYYSKSFIKPKSFPDEYKLKSVYVDNISLSIFNNLDKVEVRNLVEKSLGKIENETIWRFNDLKTKVYDLSKEEAVMTGLRLVRHRKTRQELKVMVKQRIRGAQNCLTTWKPWYYLKPTIPKTTQRKIRSVIHKACADIDNENTKLQAQARGYIGYVFHVYEKYSEIPLQIRKKLDEYCDKKDKFIFVKFFKKQKKDKFQRAVTQQPFFYFYTLFDKNH